MQWPPSLFTQTIQIMVGIINMGFGAFDAAMRNPSDLSPAPLWLGGVVRITFHE